MIGLHVWLCNKSFHPVGARDSGSGLAAPGTRREVKSCARMQKKSLASVMFCRNRLYIDMNILRHNKDKKVILFTSLLK